MSASPVGLGPRPRLGTDLDLIFAVPSLTAPLSLVATGALCCGAEAFSVGYRNASGFASRGVVGCSAAAVARGAGAACAAWDAGGVDTLVAVALALRLATLGVSTAAPDGRPAGGMADGGGSAGCWGSGRVLGCGCACGCQPIAALIPPLGVSCGAMRRRPGRWSAGAGASALLVLAPAERDRTRR